MTVSSHQMPRWQNSKVKRIVAKVAFPLLYVLNRPALAPIAHAAYDFSLRMNGVGINFVGRHGLTLGEERFLDRFLARQPLGIFVDIGANHGAYALRLSTLFPSAKIFAFEPHPKTCEALRAKTHGHNIEVIQAAMAKEPGVASLYDFADQDGSTQASLNKEAVELFTSSVVEHRVDVTTLDDFVAERKLRYIDLLKVDTEGHDLQVLLGGSNAISAGIVKAIQFEVIPANVATRTFVRDFYEALPGYALHRLCLNGELQPLGPYDVKRSEIFLTHNLVALRVGAGDAAIANPATVTHGS